MGLQEPIPHTPTSNLAFPVCLVCIALDCSSLPGHPWAFASGKILKHSKEVMQSHLPNS